MKRRGQRTREQNIDLIKPYRRPSEEDKRSDAAGAVNRVTEITIIDLKQFLGTQ